MTVCDTLSNVRNLGRNELIMKAQRDTKERR